MLTYDHSCDQHRVSCSGPTSDERESISPDKVEENALLHRVANRDDQAFDVLYTRYSQPIRNYLQRRLSDQDMVDEALNDVMMVIWQKATDCPPNVPLLAWLHGIARYKVLEYARRLRCKEVELPEFVSKEEEPEFHLLTQDRERTLARAISTLPCHERQPVELLVYHDCSYKDISIRLETPVNTIKTRVKRARTRLTAAMTG